MIDQWLKNDLQNIYERHNIAVFIDESGEAEFLLKTLGNEFTIYQADSELEELHVKYLIEKQQPSQGRNLIYTHSNKEELKFIREYCETCGCLEILYLSNYIKGKVHQTLNLNINLPNEELSTAAKVSIGKDLTFWMDLCHKGATEIFDMDKELLPFLHDPDSYSKEKYDTQLREAFYHKVNELLGQEYISKPASTLAGEVVKAMLDGLVNDSCNKTLEKVYKAWLDSVTYRKSFYGYLSYYMLPGDLDIWKVNIHHPFRKVDEQWLAEIGATISDRTSMPQLLNKLGQRSKSWQAQTLGICFWDDVIALVEFDPKNIDYLSSLNECIDFYIKHFYKLDTAIRNLYTEFLNKSELLEPFQELYKEHLSVFLDKWFSNFGDYHENQTGILQRIIEDSEGLKTAVVVGDGVSYEIAELVANKVKGLVNLKKGAILGDMPSETENNMSRIYLANGVTEPIQGNREKYLTDQNPAISIDFLRLDEIKDEALSGQILICTYKDFDDMGEKLQQKALKYFPETIDFFGEKISNLLANGYARVYLISDHGFVLTGLLSESDKITITPQGVFDKAERYIRTKDQQSGFTPDLIEVKKKYKEFEYIYFAKNINPFKTPGLYGFSHGGASPQELITPYFCWERSEASVVPLFISIDNKNDLMNTTGELFSLKIQADKGAGDLFSNTRKVYLVFFAGKTQVNKSDVFTIQRGERITKEYAFDSHSQIEVQLLDASTKQLLDRATVKQNKDRDLGGLL